MRTTTLALVLCLLLAAPPRTAAQSSDLEALDRLAWMGGCWGSRDGATSADECWLDRRGDTMVGFHVDVFDDGRVFYEFLRIVADADGVAYLASPMGAEPTAFRMVEIANSRVVFENPDHDWPQRLTYWLEGDELHALAEGLDPASRKAEWAWSRSERW
jgi:hypothetical protein